MSERHIRRATPHDRGVLFDVWLRSVRATHTFVSETDLQFFLPLARDYLASTNTEFWVLCDADAVVIGFMGLAGHQLESLCLVPEFHRRGGGRRLVRRLRGVPDRIAMLLTGHGTRAVFDRCSIVSEQELLTAGNAGRPASRKSGS